MPGSAIFSRTVAAAILSIAGLATAAAAEPAVSDRLFRVRSDPARLLAQTAPAQPPQAQAPQAQSPQAQPQESLPVYVPPRRGAPRDVAAAATRSPLTPALRLLAPDHVALTVRAQPTLYIYARGGVSVQLQLRRADGSDAGQRASRRVDIGQQAAIHPLSLATLGLTLEPGTAYRVTAMAFDQSGSVRATDSVLIERIAEPVELAVMTAGAMPIAQARAYASAGIWYDALAAIGEAIEATPKDPLPRRSRAALLQQIGLDDIAEFDRRGKQAS